MRTSLKFKFLSVLHSAHLFKYIFNFYHIVFKWPALSQIRSKRFSFCKKRGIILDAKNILNFSRPCVVIYIVKFIGVLGYLISFYLCCNYIYGSVLLIYFIFIIISRSIHFVNYL